MFEENVVSPEEQNTYFNKTFIILFGFIICNLLLSILFSVFNFYNFNYSNFYSVMFFYVFMLSCTLVLPKSMPYETIGVENLISNINTIYKVQASNFINTAEPYNQSEGERIPTKE
jgi:hypothetical protein